MIIIMQTRQRVIKSLNPIVYLEHYTCICCPFVVEPIEEVLPSPPQITLPNAHSGADSGRGGGDREGGTEEALGREEERSMVCGGAGERAIGRAAPESPPHGSEDEEKIRW